MAQSPTQLAQKHSTKSLESEFFAIAKQMIFAAGPAAAMINSADGLTSLNPSITAEHPYGRTSTHETLTPNADAAAAWAHS